MNKTELEKKMVEEAVDHEARRLATEAKSKAELAMVQIENNQRTIESALTRQELFEAEVRSNMSSLRDKVVSGHEKLGEQMITAIGRVHSRLDTLIRGALVWALGMVIALIVYIWQSQVAG